ncbi:MAG: type II toxin-antitoxin system Phd/YefM family antitoxin [Myxococcota bacterium]
MKLSEDLHPLSALKTSPITVVEAAEATGRPQILTRYGKATAVLLSIEAFEALEDKLAQAELVAGVAQAERDVEEGRLVDGAVVRNKLKGWAGEEP